jgi:hypothetical protein
VDIVYFLKIATFQILIRFCQNDVLHVSFNIMNVFFFNSNVIHVLYERHLAARRFHTFWYRFIKLPRYLLSDFKKKKVFVNCNIYWDAACNICMDYTIALFTRWFIIHYVDKNNVRILTYYFISTLNNFFGWTSTSLFLWIFRKTSVYAIQISKKKSMYSG